MEKYRQFGDGGTGANPFVPVWSNYKLWLPLRLLKVLMMSPVVIVRLAIFLIAMIWLGLAQLLCGLIPLGFLRYPLYRVLSWLGCHMALFALGVFAAGDEMADYRRLKLAPPKAGGAKIFDAQMGTLVIANHQSLVDVLYLGLKLCPTFVFLAVDGTPAELTLFSAIRRACARRPVAPAGTGAPSLQDIVTASSKSWNGPVVLFPEGARTNGSCVLTWKTARTCWKDFETLEKPKGVAVVSLVYSKSGAYTAHHTVGTAFKHILFLTMQPYQTVKTTWLSAKDSAGNISGKPLAEQLKLLRAVLARMIPGAVEVDVGGERHADFMAFWEASQKKGYIQEQKKTTKKA